MTTRQERLEVLTTCMTPFDAQINAFATRHGFEVRINFNHLPNRDLMRVRTLENGFREPCRQYLCIDLRSNWYRSFQEPDFERHYSIGVAVDYFPHLGNSVRKHVYVVENHPFPRVESDLLKFFDEGLTILNSWKAPRLTTQDPDEEPEGWKRHMRGWENGENGWKRVRIYRTQPTT